MAIHAHAAKSASEEDGKTPLRALNDRITRKVRGG